jgi:hypothetical protein
MYTLTLTRAERRAFTWIGNRYSNGHDMEVILWECYNGDVEWDDDADITFRIPENRAWEIADLAAQDDNTWPCFSDELYYKMTDFIHKIV